MDRPYTIKSIDADWKPDEQLLLWFFDTFKEATERELNYEREQFKDYYLSKGERKADWDAAFRFWCRKSFRLAKEKQTTSTYSKPTRVSNNNADRVRSYLDRYDGESNIRKIR
tara:strand:- start:5206 stop:5544 length:339 start_codon:yes stop_codon:yes gene_type:complete